MQTNLYFDIDRSQWPIIYRHEYNVQLFGLENYFPFDTQKWRNIFKILERQHLLNERTVVQPKEASKDDLLVTHPKSYLKKLKYSLYVAFVEEYLLLCLVPNFLIQKLILKPLRFQTGGTILAGKLALERGWSINLGGGFHHCSARKGGGFCIYADITLLIHFLFKYYSDKVRRIMIIDLDAHQGNGHERDFKNNPNVYILDVFNKNIYPHDHEAKKTIRKKVELDFYTHDNEYLPLVKGSIITAFEEFNPDLIVYNAGTDILEGDSLGALSVSAKGIISRDEMVFRNAISRHIPIVMLTSGGYKRRTAGIIARSIINLYDKGLIRGP
ncbi:hypothetical protein HHI36_011267 [Cryptolaemus montrouzieri]|uniref:Histone deacetylase 11 n=1 Tax=Cryptolaemus montrouzieri TaxID=559131 RepID=A0ABD2ML86_9CUCU